MNGREHTSSDWEGMAEQHGQAVARILFALFAMAWLLATARSGLPRDFHRAVNRPLRAAIDAADSLTASPAGHDPADAARLLRRFAALVRALDRLSRQLLQPGPRPIRTPAADVSLKPAPGPVRSAERRDSS